MADIAKVNDDILYLVMSHCGRHEVSAMMKTCKFLNQTGAKLLLSWLTMLESDEDIISFTDFMLGGWGNRERLRIPLRVYIEPQSLSAKSVSHLTSMLLHWGHLLRFRTLSIFRAEQLLALDPDLPGAFGRVEFIGDLFISRVGPLAKTMLQSMRSEVHLARSTIDLYGTRHRHLSDDYQSNPIFALASMRASLRRISGTWGATDPERNVYEDIVFQNVTSLKLGTKDPILVAHYAYSFPNVVNLDVSCITREEEQFTDWRNRNRTAQQGRRSWPRLTRFYGSILYWWALALKCEIERVELEDFLCLHSAILGELVQVARPKYLILNLTASEVAKQQFRALFHNEASQGLVALTLDISFEHSDRYELDVSTMLVSSLRVHSCI